MTHPDDARLDRAKRGLVQGSVVLGATAALGSVAYPVARYLQPVGESKAPEATPTDVCGDAELSPGQMRLLRAGSTPVVVVRRHDSSLIAWNALCSHLGCTVRFRPERDDLYCACHGAVFDAAAGARLSGPALAPLTRMHVEVRHGRVVVWA